MNISTSDKIGILMNFCQEKCPVCGGSNDFEIPFYVYDQAWPDFTTYALDTNFGGFLCKHCKKYVCSNCPFIFDSSRLQLLTFIVHSEDNTEIERNFKRHLEEACRYLPDKLVQDIKKKPYTFVHGCKGWQAFLKCLHGIELDDQRPFEEDSDYHVLYGYIYGKLFFYYPDQYNARFITKGFIEAARNHSSQDRHDLAYEVLLESTKIIGTTDQWLIQDLGAEAMRLGKMGEAKFWLSKAIELQHKWLAPTLSFLDPTPRRRADGETQDSSLPHVAPALTLSSVTSSRHSVVELSPPVPDYGLWYFPQLLESVIPEEHFSIDKMAIAHGIALGELEYSFRQGEKNFTQGTIAIFSILRDYIIGYMQEGITTNQIGVANQIWREYALRRWRIPYNFLEIATSADFKQRSDLSKKIGDVLGQMRRELKKLGDHGETREKSIEIFFLNHSLVILFDLAETFILSCPQEEQKELKRIRFQAEIDSLADGKGLWEISVDDQGVYYLGFAHDYNEQNPLSNEDA